mmetsp:Transcript_61803/g.123868  ORF Transcript_61803/g.123868 Transcript_61803/m.123868 type:complete len:209 (-) Transcript_61803:95-721(-)
MHVRQRGGELLLQRVERAEGQRRELGRPATEARELPPKLGSLGARLRELRPRHRLFARGRAALAQAVGVAGRGVELLQFQERAAQVLPDGLQLRALRRVVGPRRRVEVGGEGPDQAPRRGQRRPRSVRALYGHRAIPTAIPVIDLQSPCGLLPTLGLRQRRPMRRARAQVPPEARRHGGVLVRADERLVVVIEVDPPVVIRASGRGAG